MDSTAGSPLDDAIADYQQAVEAGEVPNRAELLARYPERAAGLIVAIRATVGGWVV